MKSFNSPYGRCVMAGFGCVAMTCLGGNQALVERKTSELSSINEQIVKAAVPGGVKEGDTVEVKATLRVERSPEKGTVVRDLNVVRVNVSKGTEGASVTNATEAVCGSGKIRESGMLDDKSAGGMPGFRQECLNVPATKITSDGKVQPTDGKTNHE